MLKKIKILGHDYKVNHINNTLKEGDAASCNMATLEINICNVHPKTRQMEGVVHEIIEALNYHLELELPHNKIMSLSEGLWQVLNDNEGLLK
jgi:hypothetical protein